LVINEEFVGKNTEYYFSQNPTISIKALEDGNEESIIIRIIIIKRLSN
jgi:hypothetical protein